MKIVGATGLGCLWALEWDTRLRNLHLRSQFSIFESFRYIDVHMYDILKFVRVKVGVATFGWPMDGY